MSGSVIVTGAAGFIGAHLSRALLAEGHRVVGIDNFDPFYDRARKERNLATLGPERFTFVEADILDADAMIRVFRDASPSTVFHLAALAGVRPSIREPGRYAAVNVVGSSNVLEACRTAGCRRVLFGSSSSVYGNNRKVPFAEDDDVSRPISPYAATKRAGELVCHAYCHLFGLSIAALRFFTVFGPAQRPDLAIGAFMQRVARGEEVPMFGDGSTSRDYTYVDDITDGVLAARTRLEEAGDGLFRIYNLGGSHPTRLDDLIELIGEVVGKPPRVRRHPMQPGDVERTFADLTRSAAELGFRPRTDLGTGLRRQWAWMQDEGGGEGSVGR